MRKRRNKKGFRVYDKLISEEKKPKWVNQSAGPRKIGKNNIIPPVVEWAPVFKRKPKRGERIAHLL